MARRHLAGTTNPLSCNTLPHIGLCTSESFLPGTFASEFIARATGCVILAADKLDAWRIEHPA
jgi:hypothetical protein